MRGSRRTSPGFPVGIIALRYALPISKAITHMIHVDESEGFDKIKARIVAGGDGQEKILYSREETSSPTVAIASLFAMLALTGHKSSVQSS